MGETLWKLLREPQTSGMLLGKAFPLKPGGGLSPYPAISCSTAAELTLELQAALAEHRSGSKDFSRGCSLRPQAPLGLLALFTPRLLPRNPIKGN